jgi:hypothetical protein
MWSDSRHTGATPSAELGARLRRIVPREVDLWRVARGSEGSGIKLMES